MSCLGYGVFVTAVKKKLRRSWNLHSIRGGSEDKTVASGSETCRWKQHPETAEGSLNQAEETPRRGTQ